MPYSKNTAKSYAYINVYWELEEAIMKFPKFSSPHEGYAVLKEEVDELWEEVKRNNHERAKQEAIQVAAMAIRFILDCPGEIPTKDKYDRDLLAL